MPVELRWSPQAREDLLEIYVAIGFDNHDAAERLYAKLEAKTELLIAHPRLGVRRPEIRPSTRILIESPYRLPYKTWPDTDNVPVETIEIVCIVDGRRT